MPEPRQDLKDAGMVDSDAEIPVFAEQSKPRGRKKGTAKKPDKASAEVADVGTAAAVAEDEEGSDVDELPWDPEEDYSLMDVDGVPTLRTKKATGEIKPKGKAKAKPKGKAKAKASPKGKAKAKASPKGKAKAKASLKGKANAKASIDSEDADAEQPDHLGCADEAGDGELQHMAEIQDNGEGHAEVNGLEASLPNGEDFEDSGLPVDEAEVGQKQKREPKATPKANPKGKAKAKASPKGKAKAKASPKGKAPKPALIP